MRSVFCFVRAVFTRDAVDKLPLFSGSDRKGVELQPQFGRVRVCMFGRRMSEGGRGMEGGVVMALE